MSFLPSEGNSHSLHRLQTSVKRSYAAATTFNQCQHFIRHVLEPLEVKILNENRLKHMPILRMLRDSP